MPEDSTVPTPPAGPLTAVRVLDITSVVMGPFATRILGDYGADVIQIEAAAGDRNRSMGSGPSEQFSGVSLNLLRNKRGVSLDLKAPEGRDACLAIAATCDVMITNLRPGPLRRLGLDPESIRAVRPDMVICTAHGYPSDGERAEDPAYDDIIQAASGVADLFTRMGAEPTLVPTLIADKVCGMAIVNAVLAALVHRATTGEGQNVEVPMIDVMRSFVLSEHGSGAIPEPPTAAAGYPRILTTARRPQPTLDGAINVLPYDAAHVRALLTAGGRDDLLDDERFSSARARTINSDSLYREIAAVLSTRTTDEWLAFCAERGIPATRTATLEELVAELPLARHPHAGAYRVIEPSERFSRTPASVRRHAPMLGEHSCEVLREVGYTDDAIDELVASGVLIVPDPT